MGESLNGNLPAGNYPTDAGEYKASITVGGVTASVAYTIEKATPKAEDFIFAAPTSLTYDGNTKSPDIKWASGVSGMGKIGMWCYNEDGEFVLPKDAGTYTVKINVAEGTNYKAATELTAEDWKFTISRAKLTLNADDFTFKAMDELIYNGNPKTAEVTWKTAAKAMGFGAITVKYYDKDGKEVKEPKDAGTYTVKIDVAAGVGYEAQNDISSDSWTFTIAPVQQKLTFTSPAINKMYGDAAFTNPINEIGIQGTIAYTSSNANVATVDANGTVTILAASTEPVTITASTEGTDNYSSATASYTLTVAKKAITVSGITANNKTYDGTAVATLDCSKAVFDGKLENDTLTVTATGTFADKNAGENKIVTIADLTLDGASAGNYTLASSSQQRETSASISPVRLSFITATVAEKIYDSKATATVTGVTITGLIDGETLTKGKDYTVSSTPYMDSQGNESAEAGNGKMLNVMVTLNDSVKNYTFSDGKKSATCYLSNLTIKQATPEITAEASRTITKNGVAVDISGWASFNNTDSGAKLTYTLDGAPTGITLEDNKLKAADDASTVPTFTIKVTAEATTNYTAPAEKTITVKANDKPAPVLDSALTLTPAEITYGEPLSKIKITGTMQDSATGAEVKGTFAWTNKDFKPDASDSYEAEWTFTPDAPEYATATGTVTVKVAPKSIEGATLTLEKDSLEYNAAEQSPKITDVTLEGWSETITYDIVSGDKATNASDSITLTIEGTGNYTGTATAEWKINPAELTVSAPSEVKKAYDGTTNATVTPTFIGLKNGENLTAADYSVTAAFDNANVGYKKTVTGTVTLNQTDAAKNYVLKDDGKFSTGEGTITKAVAPTVQPVELTIYNGVQKDYFVDLPPLPELGEGKTYGTEDYNNPHKISLSEGYTAQSALVADPENLNTLRLMLRMNQTASLTGEIGTVTIPVTTSNYKDINLIVNVKAENQTHPKVGTVSANAITYGQPLSASTITGTMQDPNTGATVTGTFTWDTTPAVNPNAGSHDAKWTFTPDESYGGKYTTYTDTATVTVNPKAVTVSGITAKDKVYDGKTNATLDCSNAKLNGVLENDTLTVTATGTFESANAGEQKVKISGLELSGASAFNYVPSTENNQTETTATITARRATVTPDDNQFKVYEEKDPELTYKVSGVLDGETLKGITLTRAEGENAGEYAITATADAGANPNYDVTLAKGKFTINPKPIDSATVKLGKGLIANGAEQTQTVEKVLLYGKEIPAESYAVAGNTATAPGSYTLTITAKGNYTGTVKQTYAIAPAKAEDAPTGSGKVNVNVQSEGAVPPAALLTDKAELIAMLVDSGDITAEELAQIANGASVDIVLTVKEANVLDEVKTAMAQAAKDYTIGQYLDISLFKYMTVNGSQQAGVPLHTTKDALTISVVVPDALIHTDSAVNRNYCIVRNHEGTITVLDAAFDAAGKTLTFKTDRFSIYAIAYKDTAVPSSGSNPGSNNSSNDSEAKKNEVAAPTPAPTPASTSKPSTITAMPQTGDTSNPTLYVVLLVASLLGLAVVFVCKKRNDK